MALAHYVIATTVLCIDLLVFKAAYTWPGLIIVLLGIPLYYLWRKRGSGEGLAKA